MPGGSTEEGQDAGEVTPDASKNGEERVFPCLVQRGKMMKHRRKQQRQGLVGRSVPVSQIEPAINLSGCTSQY